MSKGNPIQLEAAEHIVKRWTHHWSALNENVETIICGSIRRKAIMVRDIDILVLDAAHHGSFEKGAKFMDVELNLCFLKEECKGAGMLFLTGDHKFNIRLRGLAKSKGFKLNRYGLFRGNELIHAETEEGIFAALEVAFIQPQHRSSPDGQKGISVPSATQAIGYQVFITEVHGFNFCGCKGFRYRNSCRHLSEALEKV